MSVFVGTTQQYAERYNEETATSVRLGVMRSALLSDDSSKVEEVRAFAVELITFDHSDIDGEPRKVMVLDRNAVDFLLVQLPKLRDLLDAPEAAEAGVL